MRTPRIAAPARFLAVLAALACVGLAAAQSIAPDEAHARTVPYVPPPKVTIRTEVDVVEVPVVVRDGQHRAVAGLTRNDFEVYDTGVRQTITAFSEQHFTSQADAGSGTKAAIVAAAPAGARWALRLAGGASSRSRRMSFLSPRRTGTSRSTETVRPLRSAVSARRVRLRAPSCSASPRSAEMCLRGPGAGFLRASRGGEDGAHPRSLR